ncbi:hypothetical protein GTO10_01080, partial [Candidatus Saccharibacteria bacterium]|nr:hypothetical protein [Candidatus Saccharibacteria bacterium]
MFDRFGILRPVKGLVESGVNPIKKIVFGAKQSVMGGFSTVSFWRTGTVKIAHLEERVRELSALSGEVASLREENEKMRRLLGAGLPKAWKFLPALAVGRTEELFIDKGSSEGVEEGMMVISEKVLVGKV